MHLGWHSKMVTKSKGNSLTLNCPTYPNGALPTQISGSTLKKISPQDFSRKTLLLELVHTISLTATLLDASPQGYEKFGQALHKDMFCQEFIDNISCNKIFPTRFSYEIFLSRFCHNLQRRELFDNQFQMKCLSTRFFDQTFPTRFFQWDFSHDIFAIGFLHWDFSEEVFLKRFFLGDCSNKISNRLQSVLHMPP